MTELSEYHDDEIVAEMQRRLDRGTVGWHGLLSTEQINYRDSWWQLCEWVHDRQNSGEFEKYKELQQQINNLANNGAASAPAPTAINTTQYGVDVG